jgi:predicted tellurium resistance membrane protein TerC
LARTAAGLGKDRRQQARIGGVAAADVLRFGGAQLAFGSQAQQIQLARFQFAEATWLQVENQRAVAGAPDLLNKVANLLEHLAQLAVAALDENHFIPGIVALTHLSNAGRGGAYLGRAWRATVDCHTAP